MLLLKINYGKMKIDNSNYLFLNNRISNNNNELFT